MKRFERIEGNEIGFHGGERGDGDVSLPHRGDIHRKIPTAVINGLAYLHVHVVPAIHEFIAVEHTALSGDGV